MIVINLIIAFIVLTAVAALLCVGAAKLFLHVKNMPNEWGR